nr:hypothetical protein [Tanacetum cinerariifolium]
YAISDSPCDLPTTTSLGPSRKRCRSPTSSVHVASPVSSVEVYELYVPRETGLRVDVKDSYEPYTEPDIDPDVQADINECFAYADAIRARGMDVRVMVETTVEEEVDSSARGTEDVPDNVTSDGAVEVTYKTLGDLV